MRMLFDGEWTSHSVQMLTNFLDFKQPKQALMLPHVCYNSRYIMLPSRLLKLHNVIVLSFASIFSCFYVSLIIVISTLIVIMHPFEFKMHVFK